MFYFTFFLLVRNSGYFCLALKELKILKTHENTLSFKKFSDFWLLPEDSPLFTTIGDIKQNKTKKTTGHFMV